MFIGIDASSAAKEKKTGIDNTAYQIILNLQKIDKTNIYYLYTNKPLPQEIRKNNNFVEKLIPMPRLWHKFRLPLALFKDKPDIFLELTNGIPAFAPTSSFVLIHDLAFKYFPEAYSKSELIMQDYALDNSTKEAKKIIVTTNATKKDLQKFCKIEPNRIEVVSLGYDSNQFKRLIKPVNPLKFKHPFFLYVGRLEARKNVINIVKAFNLLKDKISTDYKLVLIGTKGYGYDLINKEIALSKYKDDIIETGYIENKKLVNLMNLATCLLYPSLYEGFGLPILEAFSCKTPVIVSNIETLKEVAGDGALIVNQNSPADISSKMFSILDDKKMRDNLVKSGTKRLKEYNWLNTATKIHKILIDE